MKSYLKISFMILLSFILTGCTVDYRLHINFDGTLSDNIIITETKENYDKFGYDLNDYSVETYQIYVDNDIYHEYTKNYKVFKDKARFGGKHYYWSLEDFNYASIFVKSAFDKIEIKNEKNKMILSAKGNHLDEVFSIDDDTPEFIYDKINLIITSDYPVIKSNADEVNSLKNEYIWHFDPDNCDKDIYLEMDSTKSFWNQMIANFRNNFIAIVILIVVAIIIIVGGLASYRLYKKSNEF